MHQARLSSGGRVVIPEEIREVLGVRAGAPVDFVVRGYAVVVIRRAVTDLTDLRGLLARREGVVLTVEEMNEANRRGVGGS